MELPLPVTNNRKDYLIQRSLEILPGFLTWTTFFLMFYMSIKKPVWVALFIICFDVYWICRGVFISLHIIHGYGLMKNNIAVKWLDRVKGISQGFDEYYYRNKSGPTSDTSGSKR